MAQKRNQSPRAVIKQRVAREQGNPFTQGGIPVAMLYPSPYRAGMSSLGFQWVLHLLRQAGFSAERAFLPDEPNRPDPDKLPLCTYETQTPVSHFPVIGVSLAYEIELGGLIQALQKAGIPPLRRDRGPKDPRIIIGGPLTFSNPLPAAPFADCMLLGEVEDVLIPAFTAAYEQDDTSFQSTIADLSGGYVPDLHGTNLPPVAKASPQYLPAHSQIITPDTELRNMFLIEGERGCHRNCHFCVMRRSTNGGMRLVDVDTIWNAVPAEANRVGLVGAAISDHPKLPDILERLVQSGREVGISSLRADRVAHKPAIAHWLRKSGAKTLTVASDASSQRLRTQIEKRTTEAHLKASAEIARAEEFRLLKVYMMVGLPGETEEDLAELVSFSKELSKIIPTALGIAPFVPKRNTPLDTAPFAGIKTVEKLLKKLSKGLEGAVDVRPTSARWAWVEAMLAQGGPEMGEAVYQAMQAGGRFAHWQKAIKAVDPDTFAPWRE